MEVADEGVGLLEGALDGFEPQLCGREPLFDGAEFIGDAILLALEKVERDGTGVVSFEELGALVKESSLPDDKPLPVLDVAFPKRGDLFEQDLFGLESEILGQLDVGVVVLDCVLDAFDVQRPLAAAARISLPADADEVWVDRSCDRLTSAGSTTYGYDPNGNQTQAGSTTRTYDQANRLKALTSGSTTTTYTYDGDGKRTKASTATQANKNTNYAWDVLAPVPQIAAETDGAGANLRQYLYGHDRIAMTTGGNTFYYHPGHLGSVLHLTSATGATQWNYAYEPYGTLKTETKVATKAPANVMKFTGEHLDPTGLYHLRARQYDAAAGRFLSLDPVPQVVVDPYVTAYDYVNGRPTFGVDPTGRCFLVCGVIGAAGGAAIYGGEVLLTDREFSAGGLLTAGAVGFAEGATGGYASRVARSLARTALDASAARVTGELAGGAVGGFIAANAASYLQGCSPTQTQLAVGSTLGAGGSALGNGYFSPQRGFEVRTLRGAFRNQPNTLRLWRGTGIASVITFAPQLGQGLAGCNGTGRSGK